ncbi:MAG: heparan-alpha-glucosaminide N-acetyltransferase domain-containing protein, partial [Polyangiales bacterium]
MQRFDALDRLRALAVVSMVQGHTFTALMRPDALPQSFMQWHALVHGLTAPAFLFGAGLAWGIASYPRYDAQPFWKRMRRYTMLIVIGYALQLPGASLLAAFKLRGDALAPVLRVGPLHLIALCLGLCQLLALVLRAPRAHALL